MQLTILSSSGNIIKQEKKVVAKFIKTKKAEQPNMLFCHFWQKETHHAGCKCPTNTAVRRSASKHLYMLNKSPIYLYLFLPLKTNKVDLWTSGLEQECSEV